MVTKGPSEELKPVEQLLAEHVCRGDWLDLIPEIPRDKVIDEATMRSWGDSQTCSATVIRDILRGRLAANPDPHGLRLRGAKITGRLDLENLSTEVSFELGDCLLEEGLLARDAHLTFVSLTGCRLEHPSEPALDADRLTCSVLDLSGTTIIGHADGAVSLRSAHIGGDLGCDGASLRSPAGPALSANGLQVDQTMLFGGGFTAVGAGETGAISLLGAHVGGQLACDGASVRNDSGPALDAERLQLNQSMHLRDGFTAIGAVRLVNAHLGGNFECDRASLRNDSGPALDADGLQVGESIFLRDGFTAVGAGETGAVRLLGAHVSGQLACEGASLRNDSGPALDADGLQVGESIFLRDGFTAIGAGEIGAVRLINAHVGGNLFCDGAKLRNPTGPALDADSLQVDRTMLLHDGFTATGGGADVVVVDLTSVRVGGALMFDPEQLVHTADPHRRLAVGGLTYAGVPEPISAREWLDLLRDGTPSYAAQPYQQLAAGYRGLGDDRQAREILMAQRDDQLARAAGWRERLWGWITKVTLGYGYQPWRALLFLAAVLALSCLLAWALGSSGALAQTDKTATPGRPCTVIQQISVGLDLNLPVGTSVARAKCDLTTDSASITAAWLTVVGWVLRLLAWAFAALFIAGFTSAVRKT